jgi:hypothetical protein
MDFAHHPAPGPEPVILHPFMFRMEPNDLVTGVLLREIDDAFAPAYGSHLMRDLPELSVRFDDARSRWSLHDPTLGELAAGSYSRGSCTTLYGVHGMEVSIICGRHVFEGLVRENYQLHLLVFDPRNGDRVHLCLGVVDGKASTDVGVFPSSDLVGDFRERGIVGDFAFIPPAFDTGIFCNHFLLRHFRGSRMYDRREVRIATPDTDAPGD